MNKALKHSPVGALDTHNSIIPKYTSLIQFLVYMVSGVMQQRNCVSLASGVPFAWSSNQNIAVMLTKYHANQKKCVQGLCDVLKGELAELLECTNPWTVCISVGVDNWIHKSWTEIIPSTLIGVHVTSFVTLLKKYEKLLARLVIWHRGIQYCWLEKSTKWMN